MTSSLMNRTAPSTARASAPAAGRVPVRARSSVVAQAARDSNNTAPGFIAAAAAAVLLMNGPANAGQVDPMSGGFTPNSAIPGKVVGKDLPKLDSALDAQPTDAVRQAANDVRDLIRDQTNSLNRSVGQGGNIAPPPGPQPGPSYTTNAGEKAKQTVNENAAKAKGIFSRTTKEPSTDVKGDAKAAAADLKGNLVNATNKASNKASDAASDLKSNIKSAVGDNSSDLKSSVKSAGNKAADAASDLKSNIKNAVGGNSSDVKSNVKSASNKASDAASDLKSNIKSAVGDAQGAAGDLKGAAQEKKKGFFSFFGGSANATEAAKKRVGENEAKSNLPSASYPNSNQISENPPALGKKDAFGRTKDYKVSDQVKEAGDRAGNLGGIKDLGDSVKDAAKKTAGKAKDLVSMRVGENEQTSPLSSASYPNSNQTPSAENQTTTLTRDVLGRTRGGTSVIGEIKDAASRGTKLPGATASGIKDAATRTADKTKALASKTKDAIKDGVQQTNTSSTSLTNRKPNPNGLNPGVSEDEKVEQKARGLQANMAQLKSIVGDKLENGTGN